MEIPSSIPLQQIERSLRMWGSPPPVESQWPVDRTSLRDPSQTRLVDNVAGPLPGPKQSTLPTVVAYLDEPAPQQPASSPTAGVSSEPFFPISGQKYSIDVMWEGKLRNFALEVTPDAAQVLGKAGIRVDPRTAEAILGDGRRVDLTGAKQRYLEETGRAAPPWLFYDYVRNIYAVPRDRLVLEYQSATGAVVPSAPEGLQMNFDYLREEGLSGHVFAASAYDKIEDPNPIKLAIPGGEIKAPDQATAERVRALFEKICGPSAGRWPEMSAARKADEEALLEPSRTLLMDPDPARAAEAVKTIQGIIAPGDTSPWTVEDAQAAMQAFRAHSLEFMLPLSIEVVPPGKHFSCMPGVGPPPRGLEQAQGARVSCYPEQRLFIPLEDLQTDGTDPVAEKRVRHELYHVLEDKYMDPRTRMKVDEIHRRTVESRGPFARSYGNQRSEFFTTMAEEFEGCNGRDGPAWLKSNHLGLYEILGDLTGRHTA